MFELVKETEIEEEKPGNKYLERDNMEESGSTIGYECERQETPVLR